MLSKNDLKKFEEIYSCFYFKDSCKKYEKEEYLGDNSRVSGVDAKVEELVIKNNIPCEKITWMHIAWKAGRLKYDQKGEFKISKAFPFASDDGKYAWDGKNGMGKDIGGKYEEDNKTKKERIENFIKEVNNLSSKKVIRFKVYDKNEFETAYERILDLHSKTQIKNFGTVYIITLIYFLSKGQFPIYDRFAHLAAKALYLDANPKDIWIGDAPSKDDKTKVFNMYNEYCELLKQILWGKDIGRNQDRALWVYGHSKKKFPLSNDVV